ncbi:hypothetical protein L218DRAFT_158633 [Marasmius fiardii PR-910]|nr:hypothetical protein L218DRAFT_158633 [Marasmius fiardii PR-910]
MYIASIIPGPHEPSFDTLDHFVCPVIEQFASVWKPGIHVSHTADPDLIQSGAVVEAGILLSVNDLPAARKVAGLQGHTANLLCSVCQLHGWDQVFNTDRLQWHRRDPKTLHVWANKWKDTKTTKERDVIFDEHGVHWSSFWLLDYWDPTRMLVVDAMHCVLEGLVHYHCRHVLRLGTSMKELNADGIKFAYDWPWVEYHDKSLPESLQVPKQHIFSVAKIHKALSLAIEGEHSLTLDQVWMRLVNKQLCPLKYVTHTLGLGMDLASMDAISNEIKDLYGRRVLRKRAKAKKGKPQDHEPWVLKFPPKGAQQKAHFVALLLNWRLSQPRRSDSSIIRTGTPKTLAHIQHVIKAVVTPAWLHSVPKNFGEPKAGSIKADEWRILSSLHLPLALVTLWGDDDGCVPSNDDTEEGLLFRVLDHTMALFQATIICCWLTTSPSHAADFCRYLDIWVGNLCSLFPHTRKHTPHTNIHAAGHIFDFFEGVRAYCFLVVLPV